MRARGGAMSRLLVLGLVTTLAVTSGPAVATAAAPGAEVSKEVVATLEAKGTASFMVYLREKADLGPIAKQRGSTKATQVYGKLTGTAERTQSGIRDLLDSRKAGYRPFWIANALRVTADRSTLDALAARGEVERIEPVRVLPLLAPTRAAEPIAPAATEWNVGAVGAPRVWSEYGVRGEGIVVATIDGGAQFDHPALVNQYRGNLGNGSFDHNYNWYDPAEVCANPLVPCDDDDGHGTHVAGTAVGDDGGANQIGVAPGAKWIAAKGCDPRGCPTDALLAAGEWVLAPTDLNGANPRPDLHADVVNNSWGGEQDDPFFNQILAAWTAAGIFPSFAIGNDGPACGTANSPGDEPLAYGVGGHDVDNAIYTSSGRGASAVDGGIKPDISAPAVNVRSSLPGGQYGAFNGTSMAAPHVTGTVALIWSAAPSLRGDVAATRDLLDRTAIDVDSTGCGGTAANNNNFGEGRLDAYQAVTAAPRGAVGRIAGLVTTGGAPLAGATVSAAGRSTTTGPDGRYALTVAAGEQEVTASKYGYQAQTATVTVPEGGAAAHDFALVTAPLVTVSGRVTDGSGHGWPLAATVEVAGRPGGPVRTDPVTGRYSLEVPGGATYRFTVTTRYTGYRVVTRDVAVGDADQTVDFAVIVEPGCTAAGYAPVLRDPILSESFDGTTAPPGWSVVNRTASGGWVFQDVRNRGNLTGGSGGFAIVDSDALGSGNSQDTDLVTPPLDFSAIASPFLRFNSDWRAVETTDSADIDVSSDGGATWTNVWHQTANRRGPRVEEVPLYPAGGFANVLVRFRFRGTFAWWWEVDNVQVHNRACTPIPGGLVVGDATDGNTGAPLPGVKVSSVDAPGDAGTSAADGFYWLFSSLAGAQQFTATKSDYQNQTKLVQVVADSATRADFALAAGRLALSATSIEATQGYGSTRNANVRITNTGNAPATVDLLEMGGGFDLFGRQGAPLAERTVPGGARRERVSDGKVPLGDGTMRAAPLVEDAWNTVAGYPVDVFDNSAAVLDGKVYSVGGGAPGTERLAFRYDPAANTWTRLPDLPVARSSPAVAAVGGKVYVLGGWEGPGEPVTSVDVFDPAVGVWRTVPGAVNPAPRAAQAVAVAGGRVYLVGGCVDGNCTDSADLVVFNPATGTFATRQPYPHLSSYMSCGGIRGKIYCAGGSTSQAHRDAHVYDPATNAWTRLPDMPFALWGSQYSAASGTLVIAGGIINGLTTITNRVVAFDPAANAWRELPNTRFSRYRGAGACGVYAIGGAPTPFVGSSETEHLRGLDLCDELGDVPWLTAEPTAFTLAPGASRMVRVSLTATAAAGIAQPGTYTARLGIRSDTPYQVPQIPVRTTVTPPASWGKVQGTVLGTTCGGNQVGVPVTIRVNPVADPSAGYTVLADSSGHYAYWVPQGRYDVVVAKDGWLPESQRVRVQAGFTQTADFALAPSEPCPPPPSGH
ncbi:S8 family serine peptidase [Phytohabitans sp. LJ34]|uniref:S8 family serine peptidase n=1 Tax=Phytohabitans sp. LJ34 TaxID=3452217 RepID=UPI003F8C05F0